MSKFTEMVDAVFRKIDQGSGHYYLYATPEGLVCTHLKPVKDYDVIEAADLRLLGVYRPGITRQQLLEDVCFAWHWKGKPT